LYRNGGKLIVYHHTNLIHFSASSPLIFAGEEREKWMEKQWKKKVRFPPHFYFISFLFEHKNANNIKLEKQNRPSFSSFGTAARFCSIR
jgi:hypothetical protein